MLTNTYTCVFYEKTELAANERLTTLRQTDTGLEIKAYILREGPNQFRVLRKIKLSVYGHGHFKPKRA